MLKGKTGVITGAGSGIGASTALQWIENGAKVVCADIDFDAVEKVSKNLNERFPGSSVPLKVDVSKKSDVMAAVKCCVDSFGSISLYFSNAGVLPMNTEIGQQSDVEFERILKVNLLGTYFAIKYASQAMIETVTETNFCSIIATGSIAALRADYTPLGYAASKGAILSMVTRANDELQLKGIRVNAVVPGGVMTKMFFGVAEGLSNKGLMLKGYDKRRFPPIEPEAIANVVTFLASDKSSAIKGQAIIADGGMSQSMGSQPYPKKIKASL